MVKVNEISTSFLDFTSEIILRMFQKILTAFRSLNRDSQLSKQVTTLGLFEVQFQMVLKLLQIIPQQVISPTQFRLSQSIAQISNLTIICGTQNLSGIVCEQGIMGFSTITKQKKQASKIGLFEKTSQFFALCLNLLDSYSGNPVIAFKVLKCYENHLKFYTSDEVISNF